MIVNSDALTHLMMMDDESVHCVITSPPYYKVRDYSIPSQIGWEEHPKLYVEKLVEIFGELNRVLRSDGTLWLNLGFSFAGSGRGPTGYNGIGQHTERQGFVGHSAKIPDGYKRKDLIGIPWLVAEALREDGWYLRATCPWLKRNSMPDSTSDRPGHNSVEFIFMLTKSPKTFYDGVAIFKRYSDSYLADKRPKGVLRQRVNKNTKYNRNEPQYRKQDMTGNPTYTGFNKRWKDKEMAATGTNIEGHSGCYNAKGEYVGNPEGRNRRNSDWFFESWQGLLQDEELEPLAFIINPRSYKGAHTAVYPPQLIEPCVIGSTSEHGVCPECGSPWKRIVKKIFVPQEDVSEEKGIRGSGTQKPLNELDNREGFPRGRTEYDTIGWEPTCKCGVATVIPATVLDPFSGSSATGVACKWHNRNYIGIELSPEYCKLGEQRILEGK